MPDVYLYAGQATTSDIQLTVTSSILLQASLFTNYISIAIVNAVENSTMFGAVAGSPGTMPADWFDST